MAESLLDNVKALPFEVRQYMLITGNYWAFTITDGALRMLVVMYFHQLGYSPLQIAMLFLFYEALTLSTYPLVTHSGTVEAKRAGRIYLGLLLGTSIGLQLLAIIGTYTIAGTTDFKPGGILAGQAGPGVIAVLFALYMFGIGKAALMPFHRWLPAAMVAPTPVSALLHAVAVVKAGVFCVLKVVIYVFGIDLLAEAPGSAELLARLNERDSARKVAADRDAAMEKFLKYARGGK